jgi:predicted glycoside hydrolase/deacetylase ChbG (UPF0249 family)
MVYGIATSATLMVPCPWAREAARIFKGLSIGVHLTLTSEYRGYRWRGLTDGGSLRDDDGFFPATTEAALQRIAAKEARVECRAQLEAALSWGVDVTHLDTHMNVLLGRMDLCSIYLDLAKEFRLPVRISRQRPDEQRSFDARALAENRGVLSNEHMVYPWPRLTRDVLFAEIPKLLPGVSEIFAHPALDGEELRAYDTANADIRAHDATCLIDPTVSQLLDEQDIKRISYRELRELQRAS